jgi:hypothetical protein
MTVNQTQKWAIKDNRVMYFNGSIIEDTLPVGVYILKEEMMTGLFLEKLSENFIFNHKVYNSGCQPIIDRCKKSWNATTTNFGVILNGLKGSGKSVTAKLLCNQLQIPIIVIDENLGNISDYINGIQQDVVIFIDEFEKIYPSTSNRNHDSDKDNKDNGSNLLSLMDGVFTSDYKRFFLATTNNLYINPFLLERPSRFRYVYSFTNVDEVTLNELIDDLLVNMNFKEDLITTINNLENYSVDIVISLIKEINLHNQKASEFISFFNVKMKQNREYQLYDETGLVTTFRCSFDLSEKKVGYKGRNIFTIYDDVNSEEMYSVIQYDNNILLAYKYTNDYEYVEEGKGKNKTNKIFKLHVKELNKFTNNETIAF